MNNLIINNIDHSKFDLEWAKRGGVLTLNAGELFFRLIEQANDNATKLYVYDLCAKVTEYVIAADFRMATKDELDQHFKNSDHLIEYIDPPMMWRDIESAPRDGSFFIATENFEVI